MCFRKSTRNESRHMQLFPCRVRIPIVYMDICSGLDSTLNEGSSLFRHREQRKTVAPPTNQTKPNQRLNKNVLQM